MAYIRSANQSNFQALQKPGPANYQHGAQNRRGYIPLAFQITSPYDRLKAMLPHALVAHVNPESFAESFNKKIERIQTRGGFVEQHWGDDLSEISVDQSTGAFVNLYTGLSSVLRQRTIAWDRYRDLYDLYRNNASVYDPAGNIVLQGHVMLMFDRGTYLGYFRSFSVEETDSAPFSFKLSWSFKVVETIYQVPMNGAQVPFRSAAFQSQNQTNASSFRSPAGQSITPETEAQRKVRVEAETANVSLKVGAEALSQGSDTPESPQPTRTGPALPTQSTSNAGTSVRLPP